MDVLLIVERKAMIACAHIIGRPIVLTGWLITDI
jgi:hypothetical protein